MSVKVKNIGLRKIIAWRGEILPGNSLIVSDEEFKIIDEMFKGEIEVIAEPVITTAAPTHSHGKKKKGQ
jgi:hypothetical protein